MHADLSAPIVRDVSEKCLNVLMNFLRHDDTLVRLVAKSCLEHICNLQGSTVKELFAPVATEFRRMLISLIPDTLTEDAVGVISCWAYCINRDVFPIQAKDTSILIPILALTEEIVSACEDDCAWDESETEPTAAGRLGLLL